MAQCQDAWGALVRDLYLIEGKHLCLSCGEVRVHFLQKISTYCTLVFCELLQLVKLEILWFQLLLRDSRISNISSGRNIRNWICVILFFHHILRLFDLRERSRKGCSASFIRAEHRAVSHRMPLIFQFKQGYSKFSISFQLIGFLSCLTSVSLVIE